MKLRTWMSLALLSTSIAAHATTLASDTAGSNANGNPLYEGTMFTVNGTGSYTNITFNLETPSGAAYATGTGFLFTQLYSGTPNSLNSTDGGYLGMANASGGLYSFGSGLSLTGGLTYYFYENGLIATGATTGGDINATGQQSLAATSNFGPITANFANYQVNGTVAPAAVTPEPSSIALLGTGLLGVAGVMRRRFAKA